MSKSQPLLNKPVNLEQLQEAARSAHRLWLPQHFLAAPSSPATMWVAICSFVLLLAVLIGLGQIFAAVAAGGCFALAGLHFYQRMTSTAGWKLDFDVARFEPVGIKGQAAVQIDPQVHSLGCYLVPTKGPTVNYLLELRHARKGPIAPVCIFEIAGDSRGVVDPAALRLLDACVQNIAQRLGVPRSGAPLPLEK